MTSPGVCPPERFNPKISFDSPAFALSDCEAYFTIWAACVCVYDVVVKGSNKGPLLHSYKEKNVPLPYKALFRPRPIIRACPCLFLPHGNLIAGNQMFTKLTLQSGILIHGSLSTYCLYCSRLIEDELS